MEGKREGKIDSELERENTGNIAVWRLQIGGNIVWQSERDNGEKINN